jgi:methylenetetrahydrofolate--tRNA-(uracil-5-)-methyltransferase
MNNVKIIGAGLAGCEAALQLLGSGYEVEIYDMKPITLLSAYTIKGFCELVCNNSFGSLSTLTPLGLLLTELELLGSRVLAIAKCYMMNDSATLSVDRVAFSESITAELKIRGAKFITEEVTSVPMSSSPVIISTGPLTSSALTFDIANRYNLVNYTFCDASCPIIEGASIDFNSPQIHQISDDLFAISIPDREFTTFFKALKSAPEWIEHIGAGKGESFVQCHTLEKLARQNINALRFTRFSTEGCKTPTLLLRRETALRDSFILVGCMTGLGHKEQKKVFSLLPALANVRFVRYGRQHRNTFFQAPQKLDEYFCIKNQKGSVFLIGQLSGLDGYAPAIASGLIAARRITEGENMLPLPRDTMIGELAHFVSDASVVDYQPMCASFSLFNESSKEIIRTNALSLINEYVVNGQY